MQGARLRRLFVALAAVAVTAVAAGSAGPATRPAVNIAMISPLTGPLSFVGVDNLAGVRAAVRELNAQGGIRGRRIVLQTFDDGSNPSQGVVHMQRIAGDQRYLGVIGSGFSSVGLAVAPIVSAGRIPYIDGLVRRAGDAGKAVLLHDDGNEQAVRVLDGHRAAEAGHQEDRGHG